MLQHLHSTLNNVCSIASLTCSNAGACPQCLIVNVFILLPPMKLSETDCFCCNIVTKPYIMLGK